MPEPEAKITFDPRPLKVGVEWHIVATYPSGQQEHITGFRDEAEATAWLTSEHRQAWLRARGYPE